MINSFFFFEGESYFARGFANMVTINVHNGYFDKLNRSSLIIVITYKMFQKSMGKIVLYGNRPHTKGTREMLSI